MYKDETVLKIIEERDVIIEAERARRVAKEQRNNQTSIDGELP
jgi:hypothetical protein